MSRSCGYDVVRWVIGIGLFFVFAPVVWSDNSCDRGDGERKVGPSELVEFLEKEIKFLGELVKGKAEKNTFPIVSVSDDIKRIDAFKESIRHCEGMYSEYRGTDKEFNKIFLLTLLGSFEERLKEVGDPNENSGYRRIAAFEAQRMAEEAVLYLKGGEGGL